jgi:hypothetical protein
MLILSRALFGYARYWGVVYIWGTVMLARRRQASGWFCRPAQTRSVH